MSAPRLLDLYCGAGGAAAGYAQAGFDIHGIDIRPQPHYPFRFTHADALDYPLDGYDVIHASPPCHAYSMTRHMNGDRHYPKLIAPTRARLQAAGVPYIIENVMGAELHEPVTLCGSMFGLNVRRHRRFETGGLLIMRMPCVHHLQPAPLDVTGGGPTRPDYTRTGGGVRNKPRTITEAKTAMGIHWDMTRAEISQAVPPAYTHWIGTQLHAALHQCPAH